MKLDLIYPTHRPLKRLRPLNMIPPLGLAMVAAATPSDVDVRIIDTYLEKIDYDRKVDLVGLTSLTPSVNQAYAIADEYRRRGVKVVMGGIHASSLPEEALQHVDSVMIGEAEEAWPRLISDFKNNKLERTYRGNMALNITKLPWARRDLFNTKRYIVRRPIETSRGCCFKCEYCSDSLIFGSGYRFREIEDVVEEIRSIRNQGKYFFFVDNNIVGNVKRARALFEALIPLNISYTAQGSINMAYNEETLALASRSGCRLTLIGMETMNKDILHRVGKPVDPGRYKELVAKFRKHGILVQGEFIFGFDEDTPKVFEDTVEFAQSIGIDVARFAILKPYPGTELYDRLLKDGRIVHQDWSKYHSNNVVFKPINITPDQLTAGRDWAYAEFARPINIWNRVGLRRKHALLAWLLNLGYSKTKNTRNPAATE